MKRSTKNKAEGELHELKGNVKQAVGRAANNSSLAAEGRGEKIGGKMKKKIGQVEKAFGM